MNRILASEELECYHANGFVVVENFISPTEVEQINTELDGLIATRHADVVQEQDHRRLGTGSIYALGLTTPCLTSICEDERILDLICPIVHPGISIYSAKLVNKPPHDPEPCLWHQDEAYYLERSVSSCRMSIWLPLQEVTKDHGCLQVVPGSHKQGLQPSSLKPSGSCNRSMDIHIDLSRRIFVPMNVGSVLLFSALLWHGSDRNSTDQNRRALIVSYQEGSASGGNGRQFKVLRKTRDEP